MTESEMAQCLRYICEAHQRELTDNMLAVYYDQLGDLDAVRMAECCRRIVKELSRLPSVSDLRRFYFSGAKRIDSTLKANMRIAREVRQARIEGKTQNEIDELIEKMESNFRQKLARRDEVLSRLK